MAENNSDSDSSITGWTVVNQPDDSASDTGSTNSSLEYVHLDNVGAIYQRRSAEPCQDYDVCNETNGMADELTALEVTSSKDPHAHEAAISDSILPDVLNAWENDWFWDDHDICSSENESEMSQEELVDLKTSDSMGDISPNQASRVDSDMPRREPRPSTSQSDEDKNHQIEILHAALLRHESDSDSEFIKLDVLQAELGHLDPVGAEGSLQQPAFHTPSSSSSSSISAQFRFVNPAVVQRLPPHNRPEDGGYENAGEEEEESLIGDFDDRCESDISGVATDDADDGDLSSMIYSIGDVPLTAGRRLYRHRPNSDLNGILTIVSLIALFLAVGVAVGHYVGASRDGWLRKMQIEKMKGAQDNHLLCLKQADVLRARIRKLTATNGFINPSHPPDSGSVVKKTCTDSDNPDESLLQGDNILQKEGPASVEEYSNINSNDQTNMKEYIVKLRAELNQVQQENEDLRWEVTRLRYTAHPANADINPTIAHQELKVKVNQLTSENHDLRSEVGKMRYTMHPSNKPEISVGPADVDADAPNVSEPVEMVSKMVILEHRLANTSSELHAERKINAYLQAIITAKRKVHRPTTPSLPQSVLSCVHKHLPVVPNMVAMLMNGKPQEYIAMVNDITKNTTKQIVEKWKEVVQLVKSKNIQLPAEIVKLLNVMRRNHTLSELDKVNVMDINAENNSDVGILNVTGKLDAPALFEDYMNKTKETVSKLSTTLLETWQKVKNLSNDFAINPEVAMKNVGEKVNVIKEEVSAKWETVKEKVKQKVKAHVWKQEMKTSNGHPQKQGYQSHSNPRMKTRKELPREQKYHPGMKNGNEHPKKESYQTHLDPMMKTNNKHPKKESYQSHSNPRMKTSTEHPPKRRYQSHSNPGIKSNNEHSQEQRHQSQPYQSNPTKEGIEKPIDQRPYHSGNQRVHAGQLESGSPQFEDTPKQFEDKPHYKQRQSNHEQYNDFWRKVEFDPDDFFEEGFFEGNRREWQKHQKRLKHLYGRIHQLNEDILYSMDDDDIEDIYDDFDDLEDDMEDDDQPQTLQMWLACQVRWWKSRLHRKHRSQDLIRGCGQQMMQWQLRALCKDGCVGKKCWKKGKVNLKEHPLCQQALHPENSHSNQGKKSFSQCPNNIKSKPGFHCNHSQDERNGGRGTKVHDIKNTQAFKNNKGHQKYRTQEKIRTDQMLDKTQAFKSIGPQRPAGSLQSLHAKPLENIDAQPTASPKQTTHKLLDEDLLNRDPTDVSSTWQDNETVWSPATLIQHTSHDDFSSGDSVNDADWIFDRALLREYHHHNPDWLFERADERDILRNKPWYVSRSDERHYQRLNKPGEEGYRQP